MEFMFEIRREEMPYASELDLQVSSQEYPYCGYSDYGFSKKQEMIDKVENENSRQLPKGKK